jgi:hypothetical protein
VNLRTAFRGEGGCVAIVPANAPVRALEEGILFHPILLPIRLASAPAGRHGRTTRVDYAATRMCLSIGFSHLGLRAGFYGFPRSR